MPYLCEARTRFLTRKGMGRSGAFAIRGRQGSGIDGVRILTRRHLYGGCPLHSCSRRGSRRRIPSFHLPPGENPCFMRMGSKRCTGCGNLCGRFGNEPGEVSPRSQVSSTRDGSHRRHRCPAGRAARRRWICDSCEHRWRPAHDESFSRSSCLSRLP